MSLLNPSSTFLLPIKCNGMLFSNDTASVSHQARIQGKLGRISNDLERKDIYYRLQYLYLRYLRGKMHSRRDIYKYFFEKHDFSEVFTNVTWWQEELFA
jgi:hypothetical protein